MKRRDPRTEQRRASTHLQVLRQLHRILPIHYRILCKIPVNYETLQFLVSSFASYVVNHAAFTLETAADEVVETDCVADLESFVRGVFADGFDVADAFMADGDWVVGTHRMHEIGMT